MKGGRNLSIATWSLAAVRVILGVIICLSYFKARGKDKVFGLIWLYILLSFAFYIPVAVAAGLVPMLGMLMLPKTICYILMIVSFLKSQNGKRA